MGRSRAVETTTLLRTARLSVLAFAVYGGWAAWANHEHGVAIAARSLLVQGMSSATTTLVMSGVIEALSARIGVGFVRGLVTSAVATLAATSLHVSLHAALGTPEIARTVMPSVIMGFAFASIYTVWTAARRPAIVTTPKGATSLEPGAIDVRRHTSASLTESELEEIWDFYRQFVRRPKGPFLEAVRATDCVFVGRERNGGRVRSFAAAKVVEVEWGGRRHGVLYNAWSAIDPAFRGGAIIQRAGLETFLAYRRRHPFRPVYFAMTSSTYKSYLLMTRNFAECWPHRLRKMPERERAILDATVRTITSTGWDPERGVLQRHGALRYTEGVVTDDGDQGDPDVAFYASVNPEQHEGDSLACIAPLTTSNWMHMGMKAVRRRLRRTGDRSRSRDSSSFEGHVVSGAERSSGLAPILELPTRTSSAAASAGVSSPSIAPQTQTQLTSRRSRRCRAIGR